MGQAYHFTPHCCNSFRRVPVMSRPPQLTDMSEKERQQQESGPCTSRHERGSTALSYTTSED
uniref:SFRICE_022488 n=1 Tax=Spodoptera frugiperda TaxID=7108 RepID=A0A2H1W4U2_SPOFR